MRRHLSYLLLTASLSIGITYTAKAGYIENNIKISNIQSEFQVRYQYSVHNESDILFLESALQEDCTLDSDWLESLDAQIQDDLIALESDHCL